MVGQAYEPYLRPVPPGMASHEGSAGSSDLGEARISPPISLGSVYPVHVCI
jgi:hypothetical protein